MATSKKGPKKAAPKARKRAAARQKPAREPNPLDAVVEMLEGYEKGTPKVKPQACADCPGEDEIDDEH
jgi:hypothetical protein